MESGNLEKAGNLEFVNRFIEFCGTSQAAEIKRLFGISYQAAKNYLDGVRLPETNVLIIISRKTDYSIHWLLTGEGEKLVKNSPREDTLLASRKLQEFIRGECREIICEMLSSQQNENARSTAAILPTKTIVNEKALDETAAFSENEQ